MNKLRARRGYNPLAPFVIRWEPSAQGIKRSACRLLPGYVFFETADIPDWSQLNSDEEVLRILQYEDGQYALRGSDLAFVAWLKKYDGTIEISHVLQVGSKVEFLDEPLIRYGRHVTKVNKNRKFKSFWEMRERCSIQFGAQLNTLKPMLMRSNLE